MIEIFNKESGNFLLKLEERRASHNPNVWATWSADESRCCDLARVLAASRDPRAAVVLGRTLDNPSFPGGAEIILALFDYFVRDLNYGLPPERRQFGTFGFADFNGAVSRWWKANRDILEMQARFACV
jgi:hypothetical protein